MDRHQSVCVDGELSEPVLMKYSTLQGSVLGPKHNVMYTKPLGDVILTHGLQHQFYADYIELYLLFNQKDDVAQTEALTHSEIRLKDMEFWMHQNMLELNADKTEVTAFSSNVTPKVRKPSQ